MNESILKAFFRRLFMIMATVIGAILGFALISAFLSLFFTAGDSIPELKQTLNATILPNANGIRKSFSTEGPIILKISIEGIIGGESLDRDKVEKQLMESREGIFEGDRVKAVILTINSPGGTVTDSDSIYRALKIYKERYNTPVYAHVEGLCASGGMYIACAADKIYTTESSIIGSIGVIAPPAFNLTNLMEKIGVGSLTLTAGKGKDELNPFRPWTKDEGKNYQAIISGCYDIFVDIVTTNRKTVNKEKLLTEYGAQIFMAPKAEEIGYIDGGNKSYSQTLAMLAERIGAKEDKYQVIELREENWLRALFRSKSSAQLLSGTLKHRIELPGQLEAKLSNQYLYLYTEGR